MHSKRSLPRGSSTTPSPRAARKAQLAQKQLQKQLQEQVRASSPSSEHPSQTLNEAAPWLAEIICNLSPLPKGQTYVIELSDDHNKMSFIPLTTADVGYLCDQIHVLARINVVQALKSGKTIAPAAEMTLQGLQDSEEEAYQALLDCYAIAYQHVVKKIDAPLDVTSKCKDPINLKISALHHLAVHLGRYQASEDLAAGIFLDSSEPKQSVEPGVFAAAFKAAEKAVSAYHEVCASHSLWEIEQANRVIAADDVKRVEKADGGVKLILKGNQEYSVGDGHAGIAEYAELFAVAEKWVEDGEAVASALGHGGGRVDGKEEDGTGGSGYPAANPKTATESMWD